jgi:hypothetical protein
MAEFSAKDVKALRDATGAGMMDAKRALTEAQGDFDRAAKALREKGLGKAAERSANTSAEGAVGVAVTPDGCGAGRAALGDRLQRQAPAVRRARQRVGDRRRSRGGGCRRRTGRRH